MTIHTYFTYTLIQQPSALEGSICAVIDVLRASTTICIALQNGAHVILPMTSIEAAQERFKRLNAHEQESTLLGGERDSVKPKGFHKGNSPLEYTPDTVNGKTIIFSTTNGTNALNASRQAAWQIVAGFVNLSAAAAFIVQTAQKHNISKVFLICSGSEGDFSYEDAICAGALALAIGQQSSDESNIKRSDATFAAENLYKQAMKGVSHTLQQTLQQTIQQTIQQTRHAQFLASLGFEGDIAAALSINTCTVVPICSYHAEQRMEQRITT